MPGHLGVPPPQIRSICLSSWNAQFSPIDPQSLLDRSTTLRPKLSERSPWRLLNLLSSDFRKCLPHRSNLRSENLQDKQTQRRLHSNDVFKISAGHNSDLRALTSHGSHRVRFVPDNSRQPKQRIGSGTDAHHWTARCRFQSEHSLSILENVEASWGLALLEKNAMFTARNCPGPLLQNLNQLVICFE
jgi:hypothetical protein